MNCDKYVRKAKIGLIFLFPFLLILFLMKIRFFDDIEFEFIKLIAFLLVLVFGIAFLKLSYPYLNCISKKNKRL